jgi:hypothetical protein
VKKQLIGREIVSTSLIMKVEKKTTTAMIVVVMVTVMVMVMVMAMMMMMIAPFIQRNMTCVVV